MSFTRRGSKLIVLCCLSSVSSVGFAAKPVGKSKLELARDRLVEEDIIGQGIKDDRVIAAMRATPRHEFVALNLQDRAYWDMSLPIGEQQTISAPFIVAYMSWSYVFWINLPIGVVTLTVLALAFDEKMERRDHQVDYLGSMLLMLGAGALPFTCTIADGFTGSFDETVRVPVIAPVVVPGVSETCTGKHKSGLMTSG